MSNVRRSSPIKRLQTIDRAIRVLEVVGEAAATGARMTDVMRGTALGRATAHRFLRALADSQMLDQDPDSGRYFLGMKLLVLSDAASNRFGLARHAAPALRRLAEKTADTIYLSARLGNVAVCLDRVEGAYPIRTLTLKIGDRRPLGIGAGSMALLAFLPLQQIRPHIAANGAAIAAFGFDESKMLGMVQMARRLGYAYNDGRLIPGMCAVGVPIRGRSGVPVAAISVAAIASRMDAARRADIVALIKQEAAALEIELGAVLDHASGASQRTLLGTAAA
jgi:DNA-binding IclR family transcriptional regulator